jgi:hypothetical protein
MGVGPPGVLHGKGAKLVQIVVRADPHARELVESVTLIERIVGMVAAGECDRPSRCRFRWREVGRDNAGFDGNGWRRIFVRPDECYRSFPPVLLGEQPGRLVLALIQPDRGPLQLPVDRADRAPQTICLERRERCGGGSASRLMEVVLEDENLPDHRGFDRIAGEVSGEGTVHLVHGHLEGHGERADTVFVGEGVGAGEHGVGSDGLGSDAMMIGPVPARQEQNGNMIGPGALRQVAVRSPRGISQRPIGHGHPRCTPMLPGTSVSVAIGEVAFAIPKSRRPVERERDIRLSQDDGQHRRTRHSARQTPFNQF